MRITDFPRFWATSFGPDDKAYQVGRTSVNRYCQEETRLWLERLKLLASVIDNTHNETALTEKD